MTIYPSRKYLQRALFAACFFLLSISYLKAQTVRVYADENTETGVVHIFQVLDYASPNVTDQVLGYYNNGLVMDDSHRLPTARLIGETALEDDWAVWEVGESMYDYAFSHTYDNIDANCGSAVDYSHDQTGTDVGNFWDFNTVAIVETAWNIISNWVGDTFENLWDGFTDWFE